MREFKGQRGKAGYIILCLLDAPVSVLLLIFGCAGALNRT